MKRGVAVVLATLIGVMPGPANATLNVLCSNPIAWCNAMLAAFEKTSGEKAVVTQLGSGQALQQLKDERAAPTFDVWWGGTGDTHLQAANEDLLRPYFSVNQPDLLPWAQYFYTQSGGKSAGILAGALGIAYNSKRLRELNLPAPSCWKDLTSEIYRGEIQIGNPRLSGTAYTTVATLVQLFGEDEAFGYIAQLHRNVAKYTAVGIAPVQAAARGETTIAISFMHNMVTLREAGAPLVIVAPCEGTGYEIAAVSIVKSARDPEVAERFVDFALSPEGQRVGVSIGENQMPSNVKVSKPPLAPDISLIKTVDYDFALFGSPKERQRLLERFDAVTVTN